jgi:hypothetical protein
MPLPKLDQDTPRVWRFESLFGLESGGQQSPFLTHCTFLSFEKVLFVGVEEEHACGG